MMAGMTATVRLRATAVLIAVLAAACSAPPPAIRAINGVAQGTTYSLQWSGGDAEPVVAAAAEDELERIDLLLSNYRPDSTLERFNATSDLAPIELPPELIDLFRVAKAVHAGSDGCFDPTVRPLVRAWGFDGANPAVPSSASLDEARGLVGLGHLEIVDDTHVRKAIRELALDMASIGQGYSAQRLATVLEEHGAQAYLAEIGGEIVARGTKPDGTAWRIGVERPTTEPSRGPTLRLPASARTVVITSGAYRHYFEDGNRRFSHVIDARTGWPIDHSLLSVTLVGQDAATTAAWATALLCLGPADAMAVADREQLAALLWVGNDDGAVTLQRSTAFESAWRLLLEEPTDP
jgi:thiamine biosynthesis lipoprotein